MHTWIDQNSPGWFILAGTMEIYSRLPRISCQSDLRSRAYSTTPHTPLWYRSQTVVLQGPASVIDYQVTDYITRWSCEGTPIMKLTRACLISMKPSPNRDKRDHYINGGIDSFDIQLVLTFFGSHQIIPEAVSRMKFFSILSTAAIATVTSAQAPSKVNDFNLGPTNLGMYVYVPSSIKKPAPIVVAIHHCQGSATGYSSETKYQPLANSKGFIIIYPNSKSGGGCFDVASTASKINDI